MHSATNIRKLDGADGAIFKTPAKILISGPSMCGKSQFIARLIEHKETVFNVSFYRIIYAYPIDSTTRSRVSYLDNLKRMCPTIEIIEGVSALTEALSSEDRGATLLILDDLILKLVDSSDFFNHITVHSHHANITTIWTSQNIFMQGRHSKSVSRNTCWRVYFDDRADRMALSTLSRQFFGAGENKGNFLSSCMKWVNLHINEKKDRYLVIDSSPKSSMPDDLLIRTSIFPDNGKNRHIFFL